MEYLLFGLLLIFLVISGPVAFIRCYILSARIQEFEERQEKLRKSFRRLQRDLSEPLPDEKTNVPHWEPPSPYAADVMREARKKAENIAEVWRESAPAPAEAAPVEALPETPFFEAMNTPESDSGDLSFIETADEDFDVDEVHEERPEELFQSKQDETGAEEREAIGLATHERPPVSEMPQTDEEWDKANAPAPVKEGEFSWQSLELLIGRKVLGWVAVAAFVLSATFFIKLAVDEGWIGRIPPLLKVVGIAAFGGAFLGAGKYFSSIGWRRFSTMLSSAGIIVIFQAGYASYAFYELISISAAGVVMSLIVLGSFLISWHYQSKLLGVISIVGGLAVPLLLSTPVDRYPQFFTYLIILNAGTVMLVNLLKRAPLGFLAFFGTQAEFWLWHGAHYVHPDKMTAVLVFQGLFYIVSLVDTTIASTFPRQRATWDDAVRAVCSPIILFGTIWLLLRNDPIFGSWLGNVAWIGAAWYAVLAVLYGRHIARLWDADSDRQLSAYWKAGPTAAVVVALGFVAIGIPLRFDACWVALGWTTVFAGLWYFGCRQKNRAFVVLSYIFAAIGFIRLARDIFVMPSIPGGSVFPPVFNIDALPSLATVAVILAISVVTDRLLERRNEEKERRINFGIGLIGYGFLTALLSVESFRFFELRSSVFENVAHWQSVSLTVLWSLLSFILLEIGLAWRSRLLRGVAHLGAVVVAVKIALVDFFIRCGFSEPWSNPYCAGLIGVSLLFLALAVQGRIDRRFSYEERAGWNVIGFYGIFSLLAILSIETYQHFLLHPIPVRASGEGVAQAVALGMLSLLWTAYALLLLILGFAFRTPSVRTCGLLVLTGTFLKFAALELFRRPDYMTAFANPYFLTILCPIATVLAAAVWTVRFQSHEESQERTYSLALGLFGILFLWLVLSIELFIFVYDRPFSETFRSVDMRRFLATASLSVLWPLMATTLIVIGLACRSVVLRGFGLLILGATILKIVGMELFQRPAFEIPLGNPYFLSIFFAVVVLTGLAVWTTRFRPVENRTEKNIFLAYGLLGVALLWGSMSIECFQYFNIRIDWPHHRFLASASLTLFWTILAVGLACLAVRFRSKPLRFLAVGLLVMTMFKTIPIDLWNRPVYMTPFWNPYAVPLGLLALSVIFVCMALAARLGKDDMAEKHVYRVIMFVGVVFLWLILSLECFKSVRMLQDAASEAWKAQMALSILWSVFAGALIGVGFVGRSPILRWMAILLFAATSAKILIVDMSGMHELYRFGAFFVLAVVLTFAAWAYQRFKPERMAP